MKQISEIIDILSDENVNLENALIKTKVLMHRMGEQEAVEWINKELTGYSSEDEVPKYRVLGARPMVRATNGYHSSDNMPAPVYSLPEEQKKSLNELKMVQSISAIAHMIEGDGNSIVWDIPYAFWPKLSEGLSPGVQIEKAWSEVTKSQLLEISTVIRSRLLDFSLNLEENIPSDVGVAEAKEKAKEIGAGDMFRNTVIGDNATIIIGDNNTQSISNSVIKNDLESLLKLLSEKGISEVDGVALKSAVQCDEGSVDFEKKEFGPAVKDWVKAMMVKAVDGTWTIGLDAAGSLLATVLAKFYGFP